MGMDYFNLLHLKKEPFSNSPEPEFLFSSPQHARCLQMLELAVRLRRGINLVIGNVGTGKTTLCRKLIQNLSVETSSGAEEIETHLLLDPSARDALDFLRVVASIIGVRDMTEKDDAWHLKEKIKACLFRKGVDEGKIVTLIIDEGQKLQSECLEVLREFLNYETNHFKLLQIVIFAQREIENTLREHHNLLDRVNSLHRLKPLNFRQTAAMIRHRIRVARESDLVQGDLFSLWGLLAVYWLTQGYPRRIVSLCHSVVVKMIIRAENRAGFFFVARCAGEDGNPANRAIRRVAVAALVVLVAGISMFVILDRGVAGYIRDNLSQPQESEVAGEPAMTEASDEFNGKDVAPVMPSSLGVVRFEKNMTLWSLVEAFYGDTSEETIRSVLAVNPLIKNRDRIDEGSAVVLPAAAAGIRPAKNGYLVSLAGSLEPQTAWETYWRFKTTGRDGVSILSLWSPKAGLRHEVILKDEFHSLDSALQAVSALNAQGIAGARLLDGLDERTVYFYSAAVSNSGRPEGQ